MMAIIWLYLTIVAPKWWAGFGALIAGGIVEAVGLGSPGAKAWLERTFPSERRRPAILAIVAGLYVWASFEAFSEEHAARLGVEERLVQARLAAASHTKDQPSVSSTASPPTRPSIIIERQAPIAPSRTPLVRTLNVGEPHITVEPNALQVDGFSIKSVEVLAVNGGVDQIKARMVSLKIELDGKTILQAKDGPGVYMAKDVGNYFSLSLTPPRAVPLDASRARVEYMIEYDTNPPTGVRRSGRTYDVSVAYANGTANQPLFGFKEIKQTEN